MGEIAEKIYCCDRDNNDNALAAAILANGNNRRDDWGPDGRCHDEQWRLESKSMDEQSFCISYVPGFVPQRRLWLWR